MQYGGHSKDHRPDLAQLKLMAAAAEPTGHLVASDIVPGQRAEDPLYVPLIQRVRSVVKQQGLLYAGDSKMAALATRAHVAYHEDYYVVPLPMKGETAQAFEGWVEAAVSGAQPLRVIHQGADVIGQGYEFEREHTATLEEGTVTWTERVQVVRSCAWAKRQEAQLEARLATASAALYALTPEPGRGKRQIRTAADLHAAVDGVLERHQVSGLLQVNWERQERQVTRYRGPGRPGPNRASYTETVVRYVITEVTRNTEAIKARCQRLGWRPYATNAPSQRLTLAETFRYYRQGWRVERNFHLLKDLPLGLSPLFVFPDEQII